MSANTVQQRRGGVASSLPGEWHIFAVPLPEMPPLASRIRAPLVGQCVQNGSRKGKGTWERAMSARVGPQRRPRIPRPMMILAGERQLGQHTALKLTPCHRLKIDPPPRSHRHAASPVAPSQGLDPSAGSCRPSWRRPRRDARDGRSWRRRPQHLRTLRPNELELA